MANYISVLEKHEKDLKAAFASIAALTVTGAGAVAVKRQKIHDYLVAKGIIPQHHASTATIPDDHTYGEVK